MRKKLETHEERRERLLEETALAARIWMVTQIFGGLVALALATLALISLTKGIR